MDPISIALSLSQFVPSVAKWITGSDKAEQIAGKVVEIAKTVTGAGTGEDALAAIKADPAKVLEFQTAVLNSKVELAKIDASVVLAVNQTMQAEAASDHWPTYGWRPFIGFSFGAYVNAQWILPLFHLPQPTVDATLITAVGAILGVASWFRGKMQADPQVQTDNRG